MLHNTMNMNDKDNDLPESQKRSVLFSRISFEICEKLPIVKAVKNATFASNTSFY